MGRDVYAAYPAAREVFDQADKDLGFALTRLCFEGPEEELKQTINVQPAVVTFSLALLAALQARPLNAAFTAGHSLGEYSALAAAGALSSVEAIMLARKRGELMQKAGAENPGAMAAVIGLDESVVDEICQETGVSIANYNSPGQLVISGAAPKIEAASKLAQDKGARKIVPLAVSGAFHTPLMAPAAKGLTIALSKVNGYRLPSPAWPIPRQAPCSLPPPSRRSLRSSSPTPSAGSKA
jgi:[acyl-carrier-protein] S-malonyltransferase